jgi:molybdopterin-guanine dinucleotide biosynthesis protein A
MERSELTGIVLAGGRSSRMGREKGLVEFRGKPFIQYGIDLLSLYTDQILISSGNPDYLPFGLELVPDGVADQGPAAGLAASLKQSKTDWNLVVACDLPFLEPELIDRLLENAKDCLAVIPVHGGVSEPLAGLYHRDLGKIFEEAVSTGNLALHKILRTRSVHYLETDLLLGKYPNLFANFNTLREMGPFL